MSDLELALQALGTRLDREPAPDLAVVVAAALPAHSRSQSRRRLRRRRTIVIAFASLLLMAATALAASEPLRSRARSWLRSVGIEASVSDRASNAPALAINRAGFGRPITAVAAAARLSLPALPRPFARPAGVFATGRAVTIVWAPGADRPRSAVRGAGALMTIVGDASAANPLLLAKLLSASSSVQFVSLRIADGGQALWISGAPHAVRNIDGTIVRFRLAANVLIWRQGALVYRLEGRFTRSVALAAAGRGGS